jgi:ribosomal protein S18 acetylase RimI-like enzyme
MKAILLILYYIENCIADIFLYIFLEKKDQNIIYKDKTYSIKSAETPTEKNFILSLHEEFFKEIDSKLKTLVNHGSSRCFILYKDQEMVGYTVCRFTFPIRPIRIWIYSMSITKKYQRQHLGEFLLQQVIIYLQRTVDKNVYLIVDFHNPALFFYKKIGFNEKIFFKNNSKVLMKL